jgi:hypothetical protein
MCTLWHAEKLRDGTTSQTCAIAPGHRDNTRGHRTLSAGDRHGNLDTRSDLLPSPRLAAGGPPEKLAYVATFDPARQRNDEMAVVDLDNGH